MTGATASSGLTISKAPTRAGEAIARPLSVLLADSDPAARHVLRRVLHREFKSTVIEADNGIAALEGLDQGDVDGVVLDLKIPVIGGLDVLRDIRESRQHKDLPVVVVTEDRDEYSVRQALRLGVSDYVLKDQHQAVIVERLKRAFSTSRQGGGGRAKRQATDWTESLSSAFTLLVIDEDGDFQHFCSDIFRSQYEVTTTSSGAHAMGLMMTQTPNAILIGTAIGTMSQASFARRARQLESLNNTRLIAVVPKGDLRTVSDSGLFDRVAVRSFVPETFLRQFENFLKAPGVLAKVSAAIPGFRSQTISAVEQVFGMMLGTEVNILAVPPPLAADGVNVGIPLSLADQNTEVLVTASVSEHAGRELAARMMQSPVTDLPDDAAHSALAEILNMVGGRVQHGLNGNGLQAQIGLPAAIPPTEPKGESIVLGFSFESMDGELQTFSFSVREQDASKGAKTQ